MPHLTQSTVRTFTMHGVAFTSYASTDAGAAQLGAWRADFAPETPGQAHRMSHEEVLYVISGVLDVEIDDERFLAEPGSAVLVPAKARFRISNTTTQPARAWVVTPLGMTATMEATGEQMTPPWAQ
jgi:mannose-6-phosphate isomerase-like protein (cupin superfamily)